MITTVNSAAALNAALRAAQSGDTIQLASGTYGGIVASNLTFAQDVTVTSANGAQAVITGLSITGSSGLAFSNLEFQANAALGDNPFKVTSSQDIHFDNLNVHGSLDGNPQNDVPAFLIRTSSDVSVTNSEFQQLESGLAHVDSNHVTVSGNDFHDIAMDGVRGGGSSFVTISGNTFHDFHAAAGVHTDAIQFWTAGTSASAHDITVSDNLFFRGNGTAAQGVFFNDEAGHPYQHVTISNNFMIGAMYNGIAVYGGSDVRIDHNTVIGFTGMKSWVRLGNVDRGVVTANTTNLVVITDTDTHITQTANILVPLASDGGAVAYGLWQALHLDAPQAPQPPVAGGLQLTGGAGLDTLTGGTGDDTLTSGGGADVLTGSAGDDTYVITGKVVIVEAADGGDDTVMSAASGFTLPANVEDLILTSSHGTYGNGNSSNNLMIGAGGADHLGGLAGADTIDGGAGADVITGGRGNDLLTGGAGADTFVFTKGDGDDVIQDFGAGGEHDVLDLSALYGAGLTATLSDPAAGATISFTNGDSIVLTGVHASGLHATLTGYIF